MWASLHCGQQHSPGLLPHTPTHFKGSIYTMQSELKSVENPAPKVLLPLAGSWENKKRAESQMAE